MKYTLLNPTYGYLDNEAEYKGFDMEHDAALYTEEEANLVMGNEKNNFVTTALSDEAINSMPFDMPSVKPEVIASYQKASDNQEKSGLAGIDLDLTDLSDNQQNL